MSYHYWSICSLQNLKCEWNFKKSLKHATEIPVCYGRWCLKYDVKCMRYFCIYFVHFQLIFDASCFTYLRSDLSTGLQILWHHHYFRYLLNQVLYKITCYGFGFPLTLMTSQVLLYKSKHNLISCFCNSGLGSNLLNSLINIFFYPLTP